MTTPALDPAALRRLADDRLRKINEIAAIGGEPATAVLAIITGTGLPPGTGTCDTSTMYHHSVTGFRRGIVDTAEACQRVMGRYKAQVMDAAGKESTAPAPVLAAYHSSLLARDFAYTLAAVLRVAERECGPQTARMLANVADDILTNGDDHDRNADVRPGTPLPPPTRGGTGRGRAIWPSGGPE